MSATISLSEYLRTVYEADCDYVDGEVQERNCGTLEHSSLLGRFIELLATAEIETHLRANLILRVQVSPTRIRVADVCLLRVPVQREQIIRTPPLLCIEILSPEDRMSRMREKVRDYLDLGVVEVWVVDAEARSIMICAGATTIEQTSGDLKVPETPVVLALADIFKVLDEY